MNERNFKFAAVVAALVMALFFTGCASQQKGPSDAYRAANDVSYAVSEWTNQRDYHRAVIGLERALEKRRSKSRGESWSKGRGWVVPVIWGLAMAGTSCSEKPSSAQSCRVPPGERGQLGFVFVHTPDRQERRQPVATSAAQRCQAPVSGIRNKESTGSMARRVTSTRNQGCSVTR